MVNLVGSKIERKEDKRFLTGKGKYTADINLINQTYVWFVRSPHARAKITKVDITKASKAAGVVKILTGEDLAKDKIGGLIAGWKIVSQDGNDMKVPPHPPLAKDSVNYVGDHVNGKEHGVGMYENRFIDNTPLHRYAGQFNDNMAEGIGIKSYFDGKEIRICKVD